MEKEKFIIIEHKYLADGLSYLGFKYYKYTTEDGKLIFSFKRSENLLQAINQLRLMKKQYQYNNN